MSNPGINSSWGHCIPRVHFTHQTESREPQISGSPDRSSWIVSNFCADRCAKRLESRDPQISESHGRSRWIFSDLCADRCANVLKRLKEKDARLICYGIMYPDTAKPKPIVRKLEHYVKLQLSVFKLFWKIDIVWLALQFATSRCSLSGESNSSYVT